MATINPTITRYSDSVAVLTWTPVTNADTCAQVPTDMIDFADRTVQAFGTFGGASINIQGSSDDVNYANCSDPQGVAIALASAAAIKTITEVPLFMRPAISGGAGSSLTVVMTVRKNRSGRAI